MRLLPLLELVEFLDKLRPVEIAGHASVGPASAESVAGGGAFSGGAGEFSEEDEASELELSELELPESELPESEVDGGSMGVGFGVAGVLSDVLELDSCDGGAASV